jgi:hypothetical protein
MEINGFTINFVEQSVEGHNLRMIMSRKAGQKFIVDKEGKLQIIRGLFQNIRFRFCCCREQRAVKRVISLLNQSIDQSMIHSIASRENNVDESKENFLQMLYFEKMARLSKRIFDRGTITHDVEKKLMPSLEDCSLALQTKRAEKKHCKDELADGMVKANSGYQIVKEEFRLARYLYKVEAVKLALRLGCEFKRLPGGSSGSYLGLDRQRKPLLVFKPEDEEPNSGNSPKFSQRVKTLIRKVIPWLNGHNCLIPQQGYHAEAAASKIDSLLRLHIVPFTRTQSFCSRKFHVHKSGSPFSKDKWKTGSCQEFKKHCQSASEKLGIVHWLPPFSLPLYISYHREKASNIISQEQFEKLVILDFIMANMDRHYGNWLIKDRSAKHKKAKAVAIDNGLSLPFKHPEDYFAKRYAYYWASMPQAHKSFSGASQEIIKKLQDQEFRDRFFLSLEPHFSHEGQRQTMNERIDILCHYAASGRTPYDLSRIKTQEDIYRAAAACQGLSF